MTDAAGVQKKSSGTNPWIAVAAGIFGTFMALLDISVTNASLPQIQGEIGATGTEGTWIGTAYLVAEIVMIPLTAWFTRLLGMRRFLIIAAVMFTLFSILCGVSENLTQMIVGRVGQGFFGGAMIPASFTIIATRLTLKQQPMGLAVYVGVVVLAPVIGPLLGGWLTDTASWHWLFFINLPIGVALVLLLFIGVERSDSRWEEFGKADWVGIAGLTFFLGALTIVLEEGQRENWYDSPLITWLTVLSAFGLVLVLITQFTNPHPVVKLRLLLNGNFGAVFGIMMIVGAGFFIMLYVVPVFLGTIAGYSAQQTGLVAMYMGISAFILTPFLAFMMNKIDIRYIVALGMTLFATGCLSNLGLTTGSAGQDFIIAQLLAGAGQVMTGMPLGQAATADLAADEIPDGSALFSMARNLGGSIGLAVTGIVIDRRSAFHIAQLGQAQTANSPGGQERVNRLAAGLMQDGGDQGLATMRALKMIAGEIHRQAIVMSYVDGFWIMGIGVLCAIPAVMFLKPNSGAAGAMVH